ncbi:hypothetical protein BS78_01G393900 [Paspalum vaginatum]|nr:hypothetical protein BS78_01G393900 [Paspalum vaginatum]
MEEPFERSDGLCRAGGGDRGLSGGARGLRPPPPTQARAHRRGRGCLPCPRAPLLPLRPRPAQDGGAMEGAIADSFVLLYSEIQRVVEANNTGENEGQVTIVVHDISLLEVVAHGSVDDVLDFLHYCFTLTSEMDCSLVILIHEDIYAGEENMDLLLHLRYVADLVVKAAPLSTGLAADVHGQLSVVNKGTFHKQSAKSQKVWNFYFKVKENGADFFYPGSRQ